ARRSGVPARSGRPSVQSPEGAEGGRPPAPPPSETPPRQVPYDLPVSSSGLEEGADERVLGSVAQGNHSRSRAVLRRPVYLAARQLLRGARASGRHAAPRAAVRKTSTTRCTGRTATTWSWTSLSGCPLTCAWVHRPWWATCGSAVDARPWCCIP